MFENIYPLLYQVNTRVWITELTRKIGRKAVLDDIPDAELDKLADSGFNWIWFLSVWQTGKEGQRVSRQHPEWRKDFQDTLPELMEEDIAGSGFAITRYVVSEELGGEAALSRLRNRLAKRGMKLMLDFVPNHSAIDHSWVREHSDYFITASESELEREPLNYTRIARESGEIILAHGRDPYFSGWPDTLQLNYGNPELQEAMMNELLSIATKCDGVRCDMAMLLLPEVFERTWGLSCRPFWPEAIRRVREASKDFCFMAEVYWDMEWTMLNQGFDYAYDKRLYDRLKEGHTQQVRWHLSAGLDYQSKMVRFLENHDEPRVAAEFPVGMHEAAAMITFFSPGLRFFHQGQFKGRKKRISPHLVRAPKEFPDGNLEMFYDKLLHLLHRLVFRNGNWQMLECNPAWEGNHSNEGFIAFSWQAANEEKMLIIVNYSDSQGQCYVKLPFQGLNNSVWTLHDLIGGISFDREGNDLQANGLYLDEPAWRIYVFLMERK